MIYFGKLESASIIEGKIRPYIQLKFELEKEIEPIGMKIVFVPIGTEQMCAQWSIPLKQYDSETINEEMSKIFKGKRFQLEIVFEFFKNAFHPKVIENV